MTISVRDQQTLLKDSGYPPGPIDGQWGRKSQAAYNKWRSAKYGDQTVDLGDIPGGAELDGVHPDLAKVFKRLAASTPVPFKIIEGTRTKAKQRQLVARGASKTMNSRHIPAANGLGHAVDVVPLENGEVSWSWPLYYPLADAIKQAAADENVSIELGGDWKWKDGPHWQLPWAKYPGK